MYNLCTTLHVSNDRFVHHQEFIIYCICSSVQTMQNVPKLLVLTVPTVWTPDDERNSLSKHEECTKIVE